MCSKGESEKYFAIKMVSNTRYRNIENFINKQKREYYRNNITIRIFVISWTNQTDFRECVIEIEMMDYPNYNSSMRNMNFRS